MTIVCGYKDRDGAVWIGADSQATGGRFIFPESVDKIVRLGCWTIVHCGNGTSLALLRRKGQAIAEASDPYHVIEIMQGIYGDADYRRRPDEDGAPDYEQACVLATARAVWGVGSDGSLWEPKWGFVAIGSGQDYAYGAATVLHQGGMPADIVLRFAIRAACEFETGCGGEVRVELVE